MTATAGRLPMLTIIGCLENHIGIQTNEAECGCAYQFIHAEVSQLLDKSVISRGKDIGVVLKIGTNRALIDHISREISRACPDTLKNKGFDVIQLSFPPLVGIENLRRHNAHVVADFVVRKAH